MKAIVRNARKEVLPRYDTKTQQDQPTLVVVVDVDFVTDENGELVHSQTYSHLPADVDITSYQRQADAMQNDVDHARLHREQRAIATEQDQLADRQILALLRVPDQSEFPNVEHAIEFHDEAKLKDRGGIE